MDGFKKIFNLLFGGLSGFFDGFGSDGGFGSCRATDFSGRDDRLFGHILGFMADGGFSFKLMRCRTFYRVANNKPID